jgi:hypothetical protein
MSHPMIGGRVPDFFEGGRPVRVFDLLGVGGGARFRTFNNWNLA